MTVALPCLTERVLHVVQASAVPLTAREVTEQIYPADGGGATPARVKNVRRILEDLALDGLIARIEQTGRERVAWQSAA